MLNKIQYRVSILIIASLLIFTTFYLIIEYQDKASLKRLLQKEKNNFSMLVDKSIELNGNTLKDQVFDYTYWDDMVNFVKSPTKKWADENLISSMPVFNIHCYWVYDDKFREVFIENSLGDSSLKQIKFSVDELTNIFEQELFPHFYIQKDDKIIELRGAPIQPTSDKLRQTEPQGYFIAGRILDSSYIDILSKITYSTVELIVKSEIQKKESEVSNQNYSIYYKFPITDLNRNVFACIFAHKHSDILAQTDNRNINLNLTFFILSILLLLALSFFLYSQIIKPLGIISKSLALTDSNLLLPVKKVSNEFGALADLIIKFFDQKNLLEEEINVRKITQEELEALNDELEQRVIDRTEELATANEQLQLERDQAKQYLNIAGTIIAVLDSDGNIQLINKKGLEILKYPEQELIGANWFLKCLSYESKSKDYSEFKNIINNSSKPGEHYITKVKTSDGEERTLIVHNTYLKNKSGTYKGVIFSAEDITELKKTEADLIAAKEKAEEINKLKSAFLANMSHELRTPMSGILGFSEILLSETQDDEKRKMIKAIFESGKRLTETLNLILDLSRLEANKQVIDLEKANINLLIKEIFSHFEGAARIKKIQLRSEIPNRNLFALVDLKMLREVMENLVNNAIKFTPKGSVTIKLSRQDNSVKIEVVDTGIGIPKEDMSLIFEEFRQVSEGIGRNYQGTGLGLTITKKYIELLKGTISVTSEINKGSTFTILLPLNDESSPDLSDNESKGEVIIEDPQAGLEIIRNVKHKILVVEDDAISRDVFKLFLSDEYNLTFASNGQDALKHAQENTYDVIIMDINLGSGMNGLEVTKKIRQMPVNSNVPIIAVTAYAMLGDKEEFLEHGCDYYVSKPYSKAQIKDLLEEILNPV